MTQQKKVPLTQRAYDKLKGELAYLEGEARTNIIEAIARARAHGDLSENAEYHAAKDQQGMQEARVRQIRQMIENAEIITGDDENVVKPGKLVTIRYEGDDDAETFFMGLREEKGGEHDVLTPDSPIGKALAGHAPGDSVVADGPRGPIRLEIVDVSTP